MSIYILQVEDEKDLRVVFSEMLLIVDPSITLTQITSADKALTFIEQEGKTVDVFILDIRLPGVMTGLDLAAKIRELGCEGRIIVTSAYQKPPMPLLQSLRAEYVSKPWAVPEFFMDIVSSKPVARPAATDGHVPSVEKSASDSMDHDNIQPVPPAEPVKTSEPSETSPMAEKPEFIFDTHGDWQATRMGVYIFDGRGEWVGFVEGRAVHTRDGEWIGDLSKDGRILRKRAGAKRPLTLNIPAAPTLKKADLPGRAPLPSQMGEIGYDMIDVLDEDPEVLKRLSDRRPDMD